MPELAGVEVLVAVRDDDAWCRSTTTPVLMARLAATKLQTFSPVCGLIAWIAAVADAGDQQPHAVDRGDESAPRTPVSYGRPPGSAT